jgi:hypothetical protein
MATGRGVGRVTEVEDFFIVSVTKPQDGECKYIQNVGNTLYSCKTDTHEINVPRNSIKILD